MKELHEVIVALQQVYVRHSKDLTYVQCQNMEKLIVDLQAFNFVLQRVTEKSRKKG